MASDIVVRNWVEMEKANFSNFSFALASRMDEAILRSLAEAMRLQLKKAGVAAVSLPWGTYKADIKTKGESGNINVSWEPSKGFIKVLNGDLDEAEKAETINQDEFDPEFVGLFIDFTAYGFFHPDDPSNKDRLENNKAVHLANDDVAYFLNEYALNLANIAKEKQRDGKVFRLPVDNEFPHGFFDFDYADDEIKVSFTADKAFKQLLKDDAVAETAANSSFLKITAPFVKIVDLK